MKILVQIESLFIFEHADKAAYDLVEFAPQISV